MAKSIKWRLVLIYVILVIIVMIICGSLIVWLTSNNEYLSMRQDLVYAVDLTIQGLDMELTKDEVGDALKLYIENNNNLYLDKKIFLLDSEGNTIFPSNDNEPVKSFYYPQVMGALYGNKTNELDNVILAGSDIEYKGYAEPIYYKGKVEYVVYILASTEKIKATLHQTIGVIVLAMILAIFMAAILGFIFSGFLTKPISILTKKAKEMTSGKLDNPIQVYSDDEIGQLTSNFNTMAKSLKDTLDQISGEKNKLEILFAYMTDGILVFDKEGVLTHNNPASENMLKFSNQKNFKDIFNDHLDISFTNIFNRVLKETVQHIIKINEKYYNLCLAKFFSQSEKQMGMICVIQDITEHKRLEELQKEFVANVSHELRTPITTIKSYTETLLDGALSEREIAVNFLEVINYESDRMTTLVKDLLDLSKLDNKQTSFIKEEFNLNELLMNSLEKFKIHVEKKEQRLFANLGNNIFYVFGDPNRTEQVIKNIISNAVKYSPKGADIQVSIYEKDKDVIIEIEDSGLGIPEEDICRIFERFYRVDKARSREMGGTGLGLSIAQEIMQVQGGNIKVESVYGEGTSFYIIFPIEKVG